MGVHWGCQDLGDIVGIGETATLKLAQVSVENILAPTSLSAIIPSESSHHRGILLREHMARVSKVVWKVRKYYDRRQRLPSTY